MSLPPRPVRPGRRNLTAVLVAALTLLPALQATTVAAAPRPTLIRDTEIEAILHEEMDPIFIAAGLDAKQVKILLVGDKELNAFATAGQQIGLHTGLILKTETPDQLKGVVAHETGHLAGGHPARSGDFTKAGLLPFLLTMGLGAVAAVAGSADAAIGLVGNASYFGTLGALGYSRDQESRADQAAVTYLEKTGQSAKGLVDFFDNFRSQEVFDNSRRYPYFRSHPLSSDRIARVQGRAEAQPHYATVDSPESVTRFKLMKAKLDGFLNPGQALSTYPETDTSYPARYARVIAFYQMKSPDRALKLLEPLLTEQPDNPYLWELKGQILFEFARAAEAEPAQRRSVALAPEAPLLRVNLGQTLIALNDPKKRDEGIAELRKALTQENDNSSAWRLLGEAYDARGDEGEARLATAEFYASVGADDEARGFAMRAREKLDRSSPQWRRATDIALTSAPSKTDIKLLSKDIGVDNPAGARGAK